MKPATFEYRKATTVADVVQWLKDAPDGKVIAGGQSLVPLMNFRLARPSVLIDINGIRALHHVEYDGSTLDLGALIHHQEIADHPEIQKKFPVLTVAARHIGHWAIRNRGTLGGSLAHADPASEWPAAMVALQAEIDVQGSPGVHRVPASEFFLGYYTTVLEPDEMIVGARVPATGASRIGFAEVARRTGDFALAGAFVEDCLDGTGFVTWFGVSDKPQRIAVALPRARETSWREALEQLTLNDVAEDKIALAIEIAERALKHSALVGAAYFGAHAIRGRD